MSSALCDELFEAILMARQRVYAVSGATPLEEVAANLPFRLFVKREDLGPIKAYKWRGAYNRMALLSPEERSRGIVAASAGNHAQGVALAAKLLGVRAKIFMPRSTPDVKQEAVRRFGGDNVEIVLFGDAYDEASRAAHETAARERLTFVHPYDDIATMGGQGTLADECVMSGKGPFDAAFLQIGGGGMAAACACWLRRQYPGIRIYGVEGAQQASMKAAFAAGTPVAPETGKTPPRTASASSKIPATRKSRSPENSSTATTKTRNSAGRGNAAKRPRRPPRARKPRRKRRAGNCGKSLFPKRCAAAIRSPTPAGTARSSSLSPRRFPNRKKTRPSGRNSRRRFSRFSA